MAEKQKDHPNINKNVHPPIVVLIYIAIAYLLEWFIRIPFGVPVILQTFGFFLTFIGFLLGVGAFIEFRKAHTTLNPHGSVKQLVTSGIYRLTRNPIYLGFLLMVVGLPLNSGIYWGILIAPFYTVTMNRLVIEREEAYLEKKFKELYTGYRSRVRRWL
jgi:protein-S-isoprenylcysteine O-methyltransferase Ste14